MQRSIDKRKTY